MHGMASTTLRSQSSIAAYDMLIRHINKSVGETTNIAGKNLNQRTR